MKVLLLTFVIIYGALTIIPCIVQFKKRNIKLWANLLMLLGGVQLIGRTIYAFVTETSWIIAIGIALGAIHIAAINNGYTMHKKINPQHHIIRLMISILLILLYNSTF